MHSIRGLLLALAAIAVAAVGAPAASAQSIEATQEGGGHCSAVTISGTDVNGGCLTHATSEGPIELRKHVFGIESHITSCNNEFAGRVNEDGQGHIMEQVLSGASCSRQACKNASGEGTPWAASWLEIIIIIIRTNFCVEPIGGGTDETCEIDVPAAQYSNQHRQEYGQASEMPSHGISGFRCELVGHWNSETGGTHDGDTEIEIIFIHFL